MSTAEFGRKGKLCVNAFCHHIVRPQSIDQAAQACLVRAFGLGTGAWALWVDGDAGKVRVRHYDARMIVPLTWDEDGCTERRQLCREVFPLGSRFSGGRFAPCGER